MSEQTLAEQLRKLEDLEQKKYQVQHPVAKPPTVNVEEYERKLAVKDAELSVAGKTIASLTAQLTSVQDTHSGAFYNAVADLRNDVKDFMKQLLATQQQHHQRVAKTLDKLDDTLVD